MSRILILNGSPRKKGNTFFLIQELSKILIQNEHEIEILHLNDYDIKPCQGCFWCYKDFPLRCVQNDVMNGLYPSVLDSDVIVFASPIYWWGVTGIMKIFIDRLYFYYSSRNKNLISGKKALVIAPMNMKQDNYKTKIFIEFFNILFDNLELVKINIFFFDNISEKGEILNNPDHIEQAYTIGKDL